MLGTPSRALPTSLNRQILDWVWNNEAGIGYLGAPLEHPSVASIYPWLDSLSILASYSQVHTYARPTLHWLWAQRNPNSRWDFGPRAGKSFDLPLSDSWRKLGNRSIDHSTHVLTILNKYF